MEKNEESDRNEKKSEKSIWIVNEWLTDCGKDRRRWIYMFVAYWCRRQKEWRVISVIEGCDRVLRCDTGIQRVCHVNRMSYLRKSSKRSRLVASGHSVDTLGYDTVKREVHNCICERITSYLSYIWYSDCWNREGENPKIERVNFIKGWK